MDGDQECNRVTHARSKHFIFVSFSVLRRSVFDKRQRVVSLPTP